MSAITKLLKAQNELINPVFNALTERVDKEAPVTKLEDAQREAAMLVGGILIGVKMAIEQAAKLIEEMDLDEII